MRAPPTVRYWMRVGAVPSSNGPPLTNHVALEAVGTIPTASDNLTLSPFFMTVVSPVVRLRVAVIMRTPPAYVGSSTHTVISAVEGGGGGGGGGGAGAGTTATRRGRSSPNRNAAPAVA